jgi:hypothetical protein
MEYLVGAMLALAVVGSARAVGLDCGRAFYPTVLIVVASYYVLFAVIGGSARTLGLEIAVAIGFSLLAILGFKKNLWLVAAVLAGHGVFDFIHHAFINNPGVPSWWPGFCSAFDVIAGTCLGLLLATRRSFSRAC